MSYFAFTAVKAICAFFLCEVPAAPKLPCFDTSYRTVMFVSGIALLFLPSSIILASYTSNLPTVLKMSSSKEQLEALATCSSHLTILRMYSGPPIFMSMRLSSYQTSDQTRILSVFSTIVTPVVNPLVCSLRNKDVLRTLRKLVQKCVICK